MLWRHHLSSCKEHLEIASVFLLYCLVYPPSWQEIRPVHPIVSLLHQLHWYIHQSSCAPISLWILKQPEIRTWTLRTDLCSFETFLLKESQARLHYSNVCFSKTGSKDTEKQIKQASLFLLPFTSQPGSRDHNSLCFTQVTCYFLRQRLECEFMGNSC